MSKTLLLDEQPLLIIPSLAETIGLNEAIVLQQLHYWLEKSEHIFDGRKWIYATYEDWQKQFKWWSTKTIQRTLTELKNKGLIETGNFNRKKYDKTNWYAINYDVFSQNQNSDTVQTIRTTCPEDEVNLSTSRSGQVDQTNTRDLPENTPDKKHSATGHDFNYTPEFNYFWIIYPRTKHQSKPNAFKKWKSRLNDGYDPAVITKGALGYKNECKNKKIEEQFIKAPETFLGPGLHFLSYQDEVQEKAVNDEKERSILATQRSLEIRRGSYGKQTST